MSTQHLSADQLIDDLYGLAGPEQAGHIASCADCLQRKNELARTRLAIAQPLTAVREGQLYQQRQAVLARAAGTQGMGWNTSAWAAGALAAGLAVGMFFTRSTSPSVDLVASSAISSQASDAADDVDLAEILAVENLSETRAAAPIRGLFEVVSDEK